MQDVVLNLVVTNLSYHLLSILAQSSTKYYHI